MLSPGVDEISLLTVLSYELYPFTFAGPQLSDAQRRSAVAAEAARRSLGEARGIFESAGHRVESSHDFGYAPDQIRAAIVRRQPDLVVMGRWRPTTRRRFAVGPVARHVLQHAGIPVLLVGYQPGEPAPEGERPRWGSRVLVATDGSAPALRTSRLAARLLPPGAQIKVLASPRPSSLPTPRPHRASGHAGGREGIEGMLRETADIFHESGRCVVLRRRGGGSPTEVLAEVRDWEPDLLVVAGAPRPMPVAGRLAVARAVERMLARARTPALVGGLP
jgi:nucleotide-binding universal stress UspA family protein